VVSCVFSFTVGLFFLSELFSTVQCGHYILFPGFPSRPIRLICSFFVRMCVDFLYRASNLGSWAPNLPPISKYVLGNLILWLTRGVRHSD
jgi:hypothetical protein